MYKAVIANAKERMEKTKDVFKRDMQSLRAGRANPQLLDRIMVDYYGTQTPLPQMANIMSPEPRMLTISLWDVKAIPLVEKAIQKSDLGMNPSNDGKIIRLIVPELNEERRKELSKKVAQAAEESKVALRAIRRDAMEHIKKLKKDSDITEDEQKRAEEELQKVIDAASKDVDKMAADKEKEILEI
jgi:ribosome recycling factor